MILNFRFAFLIIILSLFADSNVLAQSSFQTECASVQTSGYIVIKIWDVKKGAKYNFNKARKDAINAVLFSGVAGGSGFTTQPPILKTSDDQLNFKKISKIFFKKNGKWTSFTRSSEISTIQPSSLGVNNWKVYEIKISKDELRKYLEEQKIIKSLNNGF
jgi:hypothetical protein